MSEIKNVSDMNIWVSFCISFVPIYPAINILGWDLRITNMQIPVTRLKRVCEIIQTAGSNLKGDTNRANQWFPENLPAVIFFGRVFIYQGEFISWKVKQTPLLLNNPSPAPYLSKEDMKNIFHWMRTPVKFRNLGHSLLQPPRCLKASAIQRHLYWSFHVERLSRSTCVTLKL